MEHGTELQHKIEKIIASEGGGKYTNDPLDRGGPTKYGITETTARAFGYTGDMKNLQHANAVEIYKERFWFGPKFDKVDTVSNELAFVLFDWGVTSNPATSAKALQRCLNVLNREQMDYPDISSDGVIGAITIYALKEYAKKRSIDVLVNMISSLRSVFYIEIAERSVSQEKYMNGWQGRILSNNA